MNAKIVQDIILLETKKKLKITKKQYFHQHKENINEYHKKYVKNRIKRDVIFRLIVYSRNRIYNSLKGMMKESSIKEILSIDIDTYRKWIGFLFTPEMNWKNSDIDHLRLISSFDISDDKQ